MKRIATNTKKMKKDDIFVCIHDSSLDRHQFIEEASKKASALIVDQPNVALYNNIFVPVIQVKNTNETLFQIANTYYQNPFSKIKLIGITGTDGKTTTADMIYQLLNSFVKCAYLGTNGFYFEGYFEATKNTTPDILTIARLAKCAVDHGVSYLVMEVSSEALLHNRCCLLFFERALLTNISKEHLNVHKTMEDYLHQKKKLFQMLAPHGKNIINFDEETKDLFVHENKQPTLFYGQSNKADFSFFDICTFATHTTFTLRYQKKDYFIDSPYLGIYNVYNLVASIALVASLSYDLPEILASIAHLKPAKGRMECICYGQPFVIFIDYAHTTNATSNVFDFLTTVKENRIITVVGCAGGRYQEKRKEIGKIVSEFSDIAIFTMDDPRHEKIEDIFHDMLQLVHKDNVLLEKNRKKAIRKALKMAKEKDIVLILGKGQDEYMAIKNKYKKYSDVKVIQQFFKRTRKQIRK